MIRGPKKLSRRAPSQLQRERSFGVFTVAHVRRFVAVELDGKVAALGGDFHRAVGTSLPNSCQQVCRGERSLRHKTKKEPRTIPCVRDSLASRDDCGSGYGDAHCRYNYPS
jgi:hypothetical protein